MQQHSTPGSETTSERAKSAYLSHFKLLRYIAATKFRVPEEDAGEVIHDVFVTYLRYERDIADDRAWLVGATCNACRYYWRRKAVRPHSHGEALSQPDTDLAERTIARMDVAALLTRLPAQCREILRRRFAEGYSSEELSRWRQTTAGYARNLVSKCLVAARTAFAKIKQQRM